RDFKSLVSTNFTIRACKAGGGGRNRTGVHGFAGRCITTLPPRPRKLNGENGRRFARLSWPARTAPYRFPRDSGAGNESRTRDLNLGKVALYQLSYSRTICLWIIREGPSTDQPDSLAFHARGSATLR